MFLKLRSKRILFIDLVCRYCSDYERRENIVFVWEGIEKDLFVGNIKVGGDGYDLVRKFEEREAERMMKFFFLFLYVKLSGKVKIEKFEVLVNLKVWFDGEERNCLDIDKKVFEVG